MAIWICGIAWPSVMPWRVSCETQYALSVVTLHQAGRSAFLKLGYFPEQRPRVRRATGSCAMSVVD